MIRTIKTTNKAQLEELATNLFEALGISASLGESENKAVLSWNEEELDMAYIKIIEKCLDNRKQDGLLDGIDIEINEDLIRDCVYITANNPAEVQEITSGVLRQIGISQERFVILKQPINKDVLNFSKFAIVTIGLNDTEIKNLLTGMKVKARNKKIGKTVQKVGTAVNITASSTAKDVLVPTMQIGARVLGNVGTTVGVGLVNAGITLASETVQSIQEANFKSNEDLKQLKNGIRSLFKMSDSNNNKNARETLSL